jgi:hypothetical protein
LLKWGDGDCEVVQHGGEGSAEQSF